MYQRRLNDLPEWLEKRYSILWEAFQDNEFDKEKAIEILKEKAHDDEKYVGKIFY
jgi:hypothetical protein